MITAQIGWLGGPGGRVLSPSLPRRASRATYRYSYGYEWFGYVLCNHGMHYREKPYKA